MNMIDRGPLGKCTRVIPENKGNIFTNYILDRGLIFKMYQLKKLYIKKINNILWVSFTLSYNLVYFIFIQILRRQ